jgi:hypothetical protein
MNYEPAEVVSFTMKGLAKIILHVLGNENLLKEIEETDTV